MLSGEELEGGSGLLRHHCLFLPLFCLSTLWIPSSPTHPTSIPPPLLQIGLNPDRVRFRQHLQHEMAHYAEDCWDFEVECSYGWVECAGLADRSAYDLNVSAGGRGGFVRRRQPSCVRGGGCVWGASDQKQA